MKRVLVFAVVGLLAAVLCSAASANGGGPFRAGAPGIGDPYFPLAGNGGYDVGHYQLDIDYDPPTDHLDGVATISATATAEPLQLQPRPRRPERPGITVDGWDAAWTRDAGELTVTPTRRPAQGPRVHGRRALRGRAGGARRRSLGAGGRVPRPTTALIIAGEPDGAASWFPVNDHPLDKASYTFNVTVPKGLEVVVQRLPARRKTHQAADDVHVAGEGSDGLLPGHGGRSASSRSRLQAGRHALLRRDRPGAVRARRHARRPGTHFALSQRRRTRPTSA